MASTSQVYIKREIPRIAGSSAAFIAIVVILIVIIAVSCTAVIYILREDLVQNDQRHRQQYSRNTRPGRSSGGWFARITHTAGFSQRRDAMRADKSRSSMGHGQGWMHARSASDWDMDSTGEGLSTRYPEVPVLPPSMRTTDRGSIDTPRSSNSGSSPRSSRLYASTSDALSVGRFDRYGARGHSYVAQSHQGITIESQFLALPATRHLESQTSSDSLTKFSNHRSTENITIPNPFTEPCPPSTRTISSGSKFIEAL